MIDSLLHFVSFFLINDPSNIITTIHHPPPAGATMLLTPLPPPILLLFISLICCFLSPPISDAACNPLEQDSLLSFSQNFSHQLNWSSGVNCCSWDGIGCDVNDRVTTLSLPSRGLRGFIPPSILNLTALFHLDLSHNFFSGHLPDAFFSSLTALQLIDLSYNRLTGPLPETSPVNTIQSLNLSSNHFDGGIRPSLFQLNLITFNISNNSFTGSIPSSICTNSPSLSLLDFSFNDFTGEIPPGFGACSNLQFLRAGFNKLNGQIPTDIYSSGALQDVFLPGNNLSGEIGQGITNLLNLKILSLFGNQLTGLIPRDIGKLSNLEQLQLHINKLSGTLPSSLMNCTNLKALNLRVNSLVGRLSDFDFSGFTQLTSIDLGDNNFTGTVPATLFNCKSLTAIRLATNKLEGEILPEISQLQSLSFLSISNNTLTNITGALVNVMGLKNLSALILSLNNFNETLPDAGIEGFQNLRVLAVGGCNLTGQVPSWLAALGKLEVLDLSVNRITGSIPGWFGNFQNLFYADLSQNAFSGGLPNELTRLQRLSSQQGSDQVESFLELPVFVQPYNASYLQYNQLANLPPALYLGNNSLSGNIPADIGLLKFLHVLDLSNNNFSGSIPVSISNLTNLEKLDLSGNNLSGGIPASLKNLHFLSSFSVANNKLQGPIPTGGQFDTFTSISFEGNPGLCSSILQRPCTNQSAPPSHPSRHKKGPNKKIIVILILGICLFVGLALTLLALWILSKRRILPRGDPDKIELEAISFNSTSGISTTVGKDTSLVILFPNNAKEIKDLTICEILKATENFSQANIIGCGGFGLVYKATFANGIKLAVKKLSGDMGLMEREFKAEVEALSTAQHKNLVSLQGYCVHDGYRLLIYSYMENGSLDYWLHEKMDGASKLDWPTRLKIARGAGCGLAYMHQICEPHIVHRDIKSSNILLDDQFEAYVADFGLSRLILPYHTHVTTELVGTLGYIPPEYSQSWIATLRGDIYSFGVVMLELLTGKRPMEVCKPKTSRELVVWVQQLRSEGKPEEVFDPLLKGKGFEEEMLQVLDVACMCVNRNPFKRPGINEIVDWLKNVGSNR